MLNAPDIQLSCTLTLHSRKVFKKSTKRLIRIILCQQVLIVLPKIMSGDNQSNNSAHQMTPREKLPINSSFGSH